MDNTGHSDLIGNGFYYPMIATPDYVAQNTAQRSALAQFQTYPENAVQGRARLVHGTMSGGIGFGFNPIQPPQVAAEPAQILADQLGGGVSAGQFYYVPLFDNGVVE